MEFCCIIAGSDTLPTVNACEIAGCESRRYNVAASSILSWRDTIFWGASVIALRVLTYGNAVSTSHSHMCTKIYPLPVTATKIRYQLVPINHLIPSVFIFYLRIAKHSRASEKFLRFVTSSRSFTISVQCFKNNPLFIFDEWKEPSFVYLQRTMKIFRFASCAWQP